MGHRSQSSSRDEVVGHSVGGTCKSKHTHKALSVLICRIRLVSCRGLVSVSVLTVVGVNAIGEFRRLKIEMLIVAEKGSLSWRDCCKVVHSSEKDSFWRLA